MSLIKSAEEVAFLRENAILVSKALAAVGKEIKVGVTTLFLDKIAEEFIRSHGAEPAFKGLYGFPYTLCISVGDVVIHGMPSDYRLQEGDVVSVDCGTKYKGFCGDSAYTFMVGEVDEKVRNFLKTTRKSLELGVLSAKTGNTLGDLGSVIQLTVESEGYGIVREMVGHGIGRQVHESPEVPNYGIAGKGKILKEGMVLCVEPMTTMGSRHIYTDKDKWSIRTADKSCAAHFEYMVVVRDNGGEVLTTFDYIENDQ